MSMTATLTNCYVPLPATSSSSSSCHLFDPLARIDDNDGDTSLVRKNHNDKSTAITTTNKPTRGPRALRRLRLETSILASSSASSNSNSGGGGSALVEWGHTKLLVSVRGPRPITASSMMKPHDGSGSGVGLVCEIRYMPHVGINIETVALHTLSHDFTTPSSSSSSSSNNKDGSSSGRGGGGVRRVPRDTISTAQDTALLSSGGSPCAPAAFTDETRLSHRLYEALVPALLLNDSTLCGGSGGSKTCIEVFVYILQCDGCAFDAAVTGASLALVDAKIPMKDVIVASTAAVVLKSPSSSSSSNVDEYIAIADPTEEEILLAKGIVTIAIMPNIKEVTVFDQFGKMSLEECTQAMELANSGCVTMHKFVKNCLLVNTTTS